jgi:hypothetical protein
METGKATTMKPLALLAMLFLISGSMICPARSLETTQGQAEVGKGWTEELWNNSSVSTDQNASAMPDAILLNITRDGPEAFRLAGSEVSSPDYLSRERQNELWVRDNHTWTRYLLATRGDRIGLVAFTPTGGSADLYRVCYSSGNISHRGYDLFEGYYLLNISAYEQGRVMFIFAVGSEPANAVIIDVLPPAAISEAGPVSVESLLAEKANVIIQSKRAKDYDVFVDGAFYSSDIGDGVSDGTASFAISGDRMHTIIVSKRDSIGKTTYKSEHKRYFKGGYTHRLDI